MASSAVPMWRSAAPKSHSGKRRKAASVRLFDMQSNSIGAPAPRESQTMTATVALARMGGFLTLLAGAVSVCLLLVRAAPR